MERAQQMRRDLITVAVVVVLLVGSLLLLSSGAALAQGAAEDQYSPTPPPASVPPDHSIEAPLPPDNQAQVDALRTVLQTMANHAASSGAITFPPTTFGKMTLSFSHRLPSRTARS
jgi:hypothetical protein